MSDTPSVDRTALSNNMEVFRDAMRKAFRIEELKPLLQFKLGLEYKLFESIG